MCKKLWQKLFPPKLITPPQVEKWDKGEEKQPNIQSPPLPSPTPLVAHPHPSTSKHSPTADIEPVQTEVKSVGKPQNKGEGQNKGKGNLKKQ